LVLREFFESHYFPFVKTALKSHRETIRALTVAFKQFFNKPILLVLIVDVRRIMSAAHGHASCPVRLPPRLSCDGRVGLGDFDAVAVCDSQIESPFDIDLQDFRERGGVEAHTNSRVKITRIVLSIFFNVLFSPM
jgi:hypothetical protein